ncbi:MAG: hypothetical protein ACFFB5_12720 [Promethearchaeota archaeon]
MIVLLILLAVLVSPTLFLENILNFVSNIVSLILLIVIIGGGITAIIFILDKTQNTGILDSMSEYSDILLKLFTAGIILLLPIFVGWLLSSFGVLALETLGVSNARDIISFLTLSPLYFLTTYGLIVFIAIMIYKSEEKRF